MRESLLSRVLSILPRYEYLEGIKNSSWGVVAGRVHLGTIEGRTPLIVLHRINGGRWSVCALPIVLQLGAVTAKVEVCAIGVKGVDYFSSSILADTTPFSPSHIFKGASLPIELERVLPVEKPLPRYKNVALAVVLPKIRTSSNAVSVRLSPIKIQEP